MRRLSEGHAVLFGRTGWRPPRPNLTPVHFRPYKALLTGLSNHESWWNQVRLIEGTRRIMAQSGADSIAEERP